MRTKRQKKSGKKVSWRQRVLAVLLVLSMLFCQMNGKDMVTYAAGSDSVTVRVGEKIKGTLKNGTLTISGTGAMDDFRADTAPLF